MCGIVGYLGIENAYPIIIKGLKRLEYRGYDSAGVALYNGQLSLFKTKGKVADLEQKAAGETLPEGSLGIGHTRWATHGVPNEVNAHPHSSNSGRLVLVHNGIIENYESLRTSLVQRGYTFHSETDTEVLVNLIEEVQRKEKVKLGMAVQIALNQVIGAYAIAVFDTERPTEVVVAKLGSPLAIGIGKDAYYIGSDASPFIEYTNRTIYLEDNETAVLNLAKGLKIFKISDNSKVTPHIQELQLSLEHIEKAGFDHFMLKEIFEQPRAITDTFRGRLLPDSESLKIGGMEDHLARFEAAGKITIIACGTSWHAGLVGEYLFEDLARIPVEVEYASEFRYRNPIIQQNDILIVISQSGETADTLAAVKMAQEKGAFVYGICNVVGASIPRATDTGTYTHAGPEIGVASTKAFTTQITVLLMMALRLGRLRKTLTDKRYRSLLHGLYQVPEQIETMLENAPKIEKIAHRYNQSPNCLYLGRGYNFPVALEGALKLKEISYIHAEGYPSAEMKHGPIALIDEHMPVVVIATKKNHYEKVLSNIQEIKSRKGKIIAVVSEGDVQVKALADHLIEIPACEEALTPLLASIPLQLLAYYIALQRGCDVDQPRNLAKSVTVE